MVEALVLAVERRKELPPVTTLLIGEPDTLSYDESWILNLLPGPDPFIKPWMIDISDDHYALDISRARALLGWEPRHSLRNTLPIMLNDLKSDPAAWYQENDLKVTPIPGGRDQCWIGRSSGAQSSGGIERIQPA